MSDPSRLDPAPTPRRDFLGLAALWSACAALSFGLLGMLRLPKAAVLPSPSKRFKVNLPESLAVGQVFVPPGRATALYRTKEGVYALSIVCTHLGCIVKPAPDGFQCPCHGSRFGHDGRVLKGPAPAPLPRLAVTRNDDTTFVVDEGRRVPADSEFA